MNSRCFLFTLLVFFIPFFSWANIENHHSSSQPKSIDTTGDHNSFVREQRVQSELLLAEDNQLYPVEDNESTSESPVFHDEFPQHKKSSRSTIPDPSLAVEQYRAGSQSVDPTQGDYLSSHARMLISTLDGHLHCLDLDGNLLWSRSFPEGALIFSSSPIDDEEADENMPVVIPGIDGSLYTLRDVEDSPLRPLGVTLKDIVHKSPFQTHEGYQFSGKKETRLLHLNISNGEILDQNAQPTSVDVKRESDSSQQAQAQAQGDDGCADTMDQQALESVDKNVVAIARTEYAVEAINATTGKEMWNVSVSEYEPLKEPGKEPYKEIDPHNIATDSEGTIYLHLSTPPFPDYLRWHRKLDSPVSTIHLADPFNGVHRLRFRHMGSPSISMDTSSLTETDQLFFVGSTKNEDDSRQLYVVPNVPQNALGTKLLPSSSSHQLPSSIATREEEDDPGGQEIEVCQEYPFCHTGFHISRTNEQEIQDNISVVSVPMIGPSGSTSATGQHEHEIHDFFGIFDYDVDFPFVLNMLAQLIIIFGALFWVSRWLLQQFGETNVSRNKLEGETNEKNVNHDNEELDKRRLPVSPLVQSPQVVSPRSNAVEESSKNLDKVNFADGNKNVVYLSNSEPGSSSSGGGGATSSSSGIKTVDDDSGRDVVGKIILQEEVLGMGSHGTVVYLGRFEGRPVAVKRILKQFCVNASKEIDLLIDTDQHASVLRYYAMEEDRHFVYVALELCQCSIADIITPDEEHLYTKTIPDQKDVLGLRSYPWRCGVDYKEEKFDYLDEIEYMNVSSSSTPQVYYAPTQKTRDFLLGVFKGLAHLHSLNIVHRDIKPQNILVSRTNGPKLADMGLSKKIEPSRSSFDSRMFGSFGWQSPEVIMGGRLTKAVDVFSLGCVLFYTLTGGMHPFGDREKRDWNIKEGTHNLDPLEHLPEAHDLIDNMIVHEPEKRLTMGEVINHPFLWSDEKQLDFLGQFSNRIEHEPPDSMVRVTIEYRAEFVVGGDWSKSLHPEIIGDMRKYRKYNFQSVRDCLRLIRNKNNHYYELSTELRGALGPVPEGYLQYFKNRFPLLLMYTYCVAGTFFSQEDKFRHYFTAVTDITLERMKNSVKAYFRQWYDTENIWVSER